MLFLCMMSYKHKQAISMTSFYTKKFLDRYQPTAVGFQDIYVNISKFFVAKLSAFTFQLWNICNTELGPSAQVHKGCVLCAPLFLST